MRNNNSILHLDNSNDIITSNDSEGVEKYINKYLKLLEYFYDYNKLCINSDKGKLMVICRPSMRCNTDKILLHTSNFTLSQVQKVKALGTYITSGLSNIANINNIISILISYCYLTQSAAGSVINNSACLSLTYCHQD